MPLSDSLRYFFGLGAALPIPFTGVLHAPLAHGFFAALPDPFTGGVATT